MAAPAAAIAAASAIAQALSGQMKSGSKYLEKWKESSEAPKEELDKDFEKMQENSSQDGKEDGSQGQYSTEVDTVTETETEQPQKQSDKTEEIKTDELEEEAILSDENAKTVTSNESKAKNAQTAMNIFNLTDSIRKDIAAIGDNLKSKGSGKRVGENTFKTVSQIVSSNPKYNTDVKAKVSTNESSNIASDECLKQFFYDDDDRTFHDSDLLNAYKQLDVITFKYKPEATEIDPTQDTETVHTGLKAQDIEAQPELQAAVKEDPETGYKVVDTREMTMQNAAAISELTKQTDEIIKKLEELEHKIGFQEG